MDSILLHEVFSNYKKIITIEDGCITGGFGSAIAEFMIENNYSSQIIRLGIADAFIEHGEQSELYNECHFDAQAIVDTVKGMLVNDVVAN